MQEKIFDVGDYMLDKVLDNNNSNNVRCPMLLSRLAAFGNFSFNSFSLFLSITGILSSQAISIKILFHALFPQFPWSTLLPFPSYFKLHNLMYLGVDVVTDDTTIPPQTALNYHIFDLHNNTHSVPKNISRRPIDQSHPTYHPVLTTLHATSPHAQH